MDWIYTHIIAFIIAISYTNAEPRCQNDYDIVGPGCLPSDADCNGDSVRKHHRSFQLRNSVKIPISTHIRQVDSHSCKIKRLEIYLLQ